jgi:hypothetical protein
MSVLRHYAYITGTLARTLERHAALASRSPKVRKVYFFGGRLAVSSRSQNLTRGGRRFCMLTTLTVRIRYGC